MLGYRPLVYFWLAEYTDGSAFAQFDFGTGKENRFSDVDQNRLKSFGWYPFTVDLANKILKAENLLVFPAKNRSYSVSLTKGDELVAYRTNTVQLKTAKGCVVHGETVYVLGVKDRKVLHITEEGQVVDGSC